MLRTVDASGMLRAIAGNCDLLKTMVQHIKPCSVFTHAKNEGAYDGDNPVTAARIPQQRTRTGRDLRLQPCPDPADLGRAAVAADKQ